ncbi:10 kDa heat shock protein [Ascosphaera aggregata]|nr:10 kDa heat shock protein [Ascosphaera aggregata]
MDINAWRPFWKFLRNKSIKSTATAAAEPIDAAALRNIKNLVPLLDRVLVQRIKPEAKTASGIFLPESSVKELNEAKVLAVGPGMLTKEGKRIEMGVKEGDKVLIPQYGGSPVKVGDEEYHLFRDSDILAKLKE